MSKINLLIADQDVEYINSLVLLINQTYRHRYILIYFTEESALALFLQKDKRNSREKPDLAILGEGFATKDVQDLLLCPIVHLAEEKSKINNQIKQEKNIIFKYQRGDMLLNQALQICSDASGKDYCWQDSTAKTRIVAITSAEGGAGKTVTAIGLSIQSAWEGKKVFYLNLEALPTTNLFFSGEQEQSLSNVLFYLKSDQKNLRVRLEGAVCTDPWYQIDYFKEPDCMLDISENEPRSLQELVRELAASGNYDRIYIDVSSNLDEHTLSVLEVCDEILVLYTQDIISREKAEKLFLQLELLERGKNIVLLDKLNLVVNKYENNGYECEDSKLKTRSSALKIPRVNGLLIPYGLKYRLDMNSPFGLAIHDLAEGF